VEGYLTEDGHTVVTAASAREGLELLGAREFDLVITDRAMPGLSGDQLASLVKKQTPDRPVILLTGFGDFMKAAGEMPEGVDWIVSKPVTISTLRNAIERAWNIKARTHGER
jgi:two-component system response regulator HydG